MKGNKVLVIGTGISGIGSAKLLGKVGAVPVILDENKNIYEREILTKLEGYKGEKPEIIIGELPDDKIKEIVLVVPSPAVPMDSPIMTRLIDADIPVWSEIELAYNFKQKNP